jgi:hypothetical protein
MVVKISASFAYHEQDPAKREKVMSRVCPICKRTLREHSPEEYVECRRKKEVGATVTEE